MLEDPRSNRAAQNLHRQWLDSDDLEFVFPDESAYPKWDYAMQDSMRWELDNLVQTTFSGGDPTLRNLLMSRETDVDQGLSELYDAPVGTTSLPAGERVGILTCAGWLATTSHPVHPSPVQRGVFVLERVMCVPIAAPPADVDTNVPQGGGAVTNRERYSEHSANSRCSSCHSSIDPIGFGLENYDSIGQYRTHDNGQEVDATGEFVDGDLGGKSFNGAVEMSSLLADSQMVHNCYALQWYRYAMGRTESGGDASTVEALENSFWLSGGELPQLVVDIVRTDLFRSRRTQ